MENEIPSEGLEVDVNITLGRQEIVAIVGISAVTSTLTFMTLGIISSFMKRELAKIRAQEAEVSQD